MVDLILTGALAVSFVAGWHAHRACGSLEGLIQKIKDKVSSK